VRLHRILHATDFSPASRAAFRMAVALAQREPARLLLLHVLTPPSPLVSGRRPPSSYLELLAMARRAARRRLDQALREARSAGGRVEGKLVEGGAVDEILKAGRRWRPDLIVIGTHGRGGVRRFLLGSVAEQVVRRASRPVLTVRGR
jgi:nucleotide-binding universal stress UspA family protein